MFDSFPTKDNLSKFPKTYLKFSCGSVPLAAPEVEDDFRSDRKSWYLSFQLVDLLLGLWMLIVIESVAPSPCELGSLLLPLPAVIRGALS